MKLFTSFQLAPSIGHYSIPPSLIILTSLSPVSPSPLYTISASYPIDFPSCQASSHLAPDLSSWTPSKSGHGSHDLTSAVTLSILQGRGEHTVRGRRGRRLARRTEGLEVLVHHLFPRPFRPPHRRRVCESLFLTVSEASSFHLNTWTLTHCVAYVDRNWSCTSDDHT